MLSENNPDMYFDCACSKVYNAEYNSEEGYRYDLYVSACEGSNHQVEEVTALSVTFKFADSTITKVELWNTNYGIECTCEDPYDCECGYYGVIECEVENGVCTVELPLDADGYLFHDGLITIHRGASSKDGAFNYSVIMPYGEHEAGGTGNHAECE